MVLLFLYIIIIQIAKMYNVQQIRRARCGTLTPGQQCAVVEAPCLIILKIKKKTRCATNYRVLQ